MEIIINTEGWADSHIIHGDGVWTMAGIKDDKLRQFFISLLKRLAAQGFVRVSVFPGKYGSSLLINDQLKARVAGSLDEKLFKEFVIMMTLLCKEIIGRVYEGRGGRECSFCGSEMRVMQSNCENKSCTEKQVLEWLND